jgi:L-rhamnose isomerase
MQTASVIQTLARRSCNVAAFIYDRTFREWREYDWDKLRWDHINTELYSEAMTLGLKVKFDSLSKGTRYKQPFPTSGAPAKS